MISVFISQSCFPNVQGGGTTRFPSVNKIQRYLAFALCIICTPISLEGQTGEDWFEKGLEAFRWQRNDEASLYFRKAAESNPARDEFFLYLGIAEHQVGRLDGAEEAYDRGIDLNGPYIEQIQFRRGNLRWSMGNFDGAQEDYTAVVDGGGSLTSSALLNRGNMELVIGNHSSALSDYTNFLIMEPDAADRETIEEIIALLNADIERVRLAEVRRAEEEARRQALMVEVLESLSGSGEDTSSISAGTETLLEEFEESALED